MKLLLEDFLASVGFGLGAACIVGFVTVATGGWTDSSWRMVGLFWAGFTLFTLALLMFLQGAREER